MANSQPAPVNDTAAHPAHAPVQGAISPETQQPDSSLKGPPESRESRSNSNPESGSPTGYSMMAGRLRSASKKFETSSIPTGMWSATGSLASSAPSLADIRRGSYGSDGWSGEGQLKEKTRRASLVRRQSTKVVENSGLSDVTEHQNLENTTDNVPADNKQLNTNALEEHSTPRDVRGSIVQDSTDSASPANVSTAEKSLKYRTEPFDNGYQFPPKHPWKESTIIGLKAFWKFTITPLGFLVVLYGCNVVAWGGMLFLLLCNAAPAMCYPTCDDINSPRRVWVEIDSQVVNGLFCVTGFGLIPWRFRDLYYLLKYRIQGDEFSLRRLAGIHRGWFRLEGSSKLPVEIGPENIEVEFPTLSPSSVPYPLKAIPSAPLTGIRAPPTPLWKLDYVVWMFVWNTFLQGVLSGIMWGLNRYDRPSWTTGTFVALACIVAALAGIMVFMEGNKIKEIEGIPVSAEDQERLKRDHEMGIVHFNNLKNEKPKPEKEQASLFRRSLHLVRDVELKEDTSTQPGTIKTGL